MNRISRFNSGICKSSEIFLQTTVLSAHAWGFTISQVRFEICVVLSLFCSKIYIVKIYGYLQECIGSLYLFECYSGLCLASGGG